MTFVGVIMYATVKFKGLPALITERAVEEGIASSKTDVLRFSLLLLNKEYGLVKDYEAEMAIKKMQKLEEGAKKGKIKLLSEKQVLSKYPNLK